ncbi:ABC transporter ATP-binding protein [Clavibacter lycopersici]|uniref:ABC transporter ATP-binding protein n=1 Tax=Clavibacter lycopersici TaxID=2301718 RepID=A0A399SS37_9MICO|nr:ABC transporter ATP-binding protein [Clavibacter lycopersici]RIJ45719.1 ABC transporter ATP-binding protein [Clavibacter lycopersici]RIJ57836.1 ABC transporter ATP-binding protein [Clavibacter lycopersici]
MIRAEHVRVVAGGRVLLDDVSFEAPTGSVTGIVGPNGGGKTTLLRALVRAAPLAGGRVTVDGEDVRTRSRRWIARRVAEVGQRQDPDESLTVADEVALGGLAGRGVLRPHGSGDDDRVAAALEAVGMAHLAGDRLATLSGGELQRIALARALAQGAGHVLLDEPTNHLDIRHRLEVARLMRRIAPTVVVVLHDLEVAAEVCDHVVVLHRGRVAGAGAPADVLRPELLDAVYDVRTTVLADADGRPHLRFTLPAVGDPPAATIPLERTRP